MLHTLDAGIIGSLRKAAGIPEDRADDFSEELKRLHVWFDGQLKAWKARPMAKTSQRESRKRVSTALRDSLAAIRRRDPAAIDRLTLDNREVLAELMHEQDDYQARGKRHGMVSLPATCITSAGGRVFFVNASQNPSFGEVDLNPLRFES